MLFRSNDTATTEIYTLSLHDALPICIQNLLNRMLSNIQFLMQNDLGGRSSESLAQMPMNAVRMAMAVIGILPILCIYPFFQKYLVKGLVIGAVKG